MIKTKVVLFLPGVNEALLGDCFDEGHACAVIVPLILFFYTRATNEAVLRQKIALWGHRWLFSKIDNDGLQ